MCVSVRERVHMSVSDCTHEGERELVKVKALP